MRLFVHALSFGTLSQQTSFFLLRRFHKIYFDNLLLIVFISKFTTTMKISSCLILAPVALAAAQGGIISDATSVLSDATSKCEHGYDLVV